MDSPVSDASVDQDRDFELFREVHDDLVQKATVGWQNAVTSMEAALIHYDTNEAQYFMKHSVDRVIGIMLDQIPNRIGKFEKSCVINSILNAVPVVVAQLRHGNIEFLSLACTLMNKKRCFYSKDYGGGRSPHSNSSYKSPNYHNSSSSGCPEIRTQCVTKFVDLKGFDTILEMFESCPEGELPITTDDAQILFSVFTDYPNLIEKNVIEFLSHKVLSHLSKSTSEELKKEPTEVIAGILLEVQRLIEKNVLTKEAFKLWLEITQIYVASASLPQRLFGYEQVTTLLSLAKSSRPFPPSYNITGAGTTCVNGLYTLCAEEGKSAMGGKSAKYIKNSENVLTLFRCTMRSGSKWWFISEADKDQPGTDKDIDYYQRQATGDDCDNDDSIPPLANWQCIGRGVDPVPLLTAQKAHCNNESQLLETLFVNWVQKSQLLQQAFGGRIHREVVSRSSGLIKYLSSCTGGMPDDSIDVIWNSAVDKDEDLVEEIHDVLVSIVPIMNDKSLVHLMTKASESLLQNYSMSMAFASKMCKELDIEDVLLRKSAAVTDSVLEFLWNLKRHPKKKERNDDNSSLQKFFSDALKSTHGERKRKGFLVDCVTQLKRAVDSHAEGDSASTDLALLKFLIDTYDEGFQASVVEDLNNEYQVTCLLFQELVVFSENSRKNESYLSGIRHRLNLVRYLYGKTSKLDLTVEDITNNLWNILKSPAEKELCFVFLQNAGTRTGGLEPAFDTTVSSHIFNELICEQTDFATLGELGYKCFHKYFCDVNCEKGLLSVHHSNGEIKQANSLSLVGFDALWRIALDSPSSVADAAVEEILVVYKSRGIKSLSSTKDFIRRVMTRLGTFSVKNTEVVHHSMALLSGLLVDGVSSSTHGTDGQGNQYPVRVIPRYISSGGGNNTKPKKIAPFTMTVHSQLSASKFKEMIEARVNHPINQTKIMVNGNQLVDNKLSMKELNVTRNKNVQVLMFPNVVSQNAVTVSPTKTSSRSEQNPGNIFAESLEYFETLFSILDRLSTENHHSSAARDKVLTFLENVPTNRQLASSVLTLDSIFTPVANPVTKKLENRLLDPSCYHKSVYVMEVIDALLLPNERATHNSAEWTSKLLQSGGFEQVLEFFIRDHTGLSSGNSIALRIVKFCLFDDQSTTSNTRVRDSALLANVDFAALMKKLMEIVLTENKRKANTNVQVVLDTLLTIQALLLSGSSHSSTIFDSSTFSAQLELCLIPLLLQNESKHVRDQWYLTLVAICKSSNVALVKVMTVLQKELSTISSDFVASDKFFMLLKTLLPLLNDGNNNNIPKNVITTILSKFSSGFKTTTDLDDGKRADVIIGCLQVLGVVLKKEEDSEEFTELNLRILQVIYDDCLFAMPIKGQKRWPLCASVESRKPALELLQTLSTLNSASLQGLIARTCRFLERSTDVLNGLWGQECVVDARGPSGQVGLKNQGCTCYMNSFLQQIFMEPFLRKGVLEASVPCKPSTETSLTPSQVKLNPELVVNHIIANRCYNGKTFEATVLSYDATTGMHKIRYFEGEDAVLKLHEGRPNKETGEYRVVAKDLDEAEGTLEVLRQVQRTFCYLRDSERRYFNPKDLVDACKCLNLEFSVYQQNDASEFCDKLLDRLESGMKKTLQGTRCLQESLGGKVVSQKLPKDCTHVYERDEPFIRIELQIRGKDNIEESLAAFVEGELMDGDNMVECERCDTKRAVIRRTCFGTLPNLLVLHLKRFDLDFTTFETVKLNNRCAFPLTLNMKPFTKVGIEQDQSGNIVLDDEEDFEYHLKGVLVHSGVAQGGHYYSFIVDRETGKWSKFDDEDVSPFDPANIETECFGGMQNRTTTNWNGVNNTVEMEMFSNALMLFYDKVKRVEVVDVKEDGVTTSSATLEEPSCDFESMVCEENERFMLNNYLMDYEFQEFLRKTILNGSNSNENNNLMLAKLGTQFMLDALLHTREKNSVSEWQIALEKRFEEDLSACRWFLQAAFVDLSTKWGKEFLFYCPDPVARQNFVSLATSAVRAAGDNDEAFIVKIASTIVGFISKKELLRTSTSRHNLPSLDDLMTLVRNCASANRSFALGLVQKNVIAILVYIFLGSDSPGYLKDFAMLNDITDFANQVTDVQCMLEAILIMLEIPSRASVPLLQGHNKLSTRAEAALRIVYHEFANPETKLMGKNELKNYFRACGTTIQEAMETGKKIKHILNTYNNGDSNNTAIDIEGFLRFYNETTSAVGNFNKGRRLLADLKALGFGDNLQREDVALPSSHELLKNVPELSKKALLSHELMSVVASSSSSVANQGGGDSVDEYAAELLYRLSVGDLEVSTQTLQCFLQQGSRNSSYVVKLLSYKFDGQKALIETALSNDEFGILKLAKQNSISTSSNDYRYSSGRASPSVLCYRQITLVLEMYKSKELREYLNRNLSEWEWMHPWLTTESLKPSLNGRAATLYREADKLQALEALSEIHNLPMVDDTVSYKVSGAGSSEVNGIYTLESEFDGCSTYTMDDGTDGVTYTLFRCRMPSGARRYYISIVPSGQPPGTASDIDFYYVAVTERDVSPPTERKAWKVWSKNAAARAPAPVLTVVPVKSTTRVATTSTTVTTQPEDEHNLRNSNDRLSNLDLDEDDDDSSSSDDDNTGRSKSRFV